jgi:hypothetical protein
MRLGKVVTIKLASGEVVRARALGANENPVYRVCLAIINRRLSADWCSDKDGLHVGDRHLKVKDILGIVLTINGVSPYTGVIKAPAENVPGLPMMGNLRPTMTPVTTLFAAAEIRELEREMREVERGTGLKLRGSVSDYVRVIVVNHLARVRR